jgi:hypothetical protein
VTLSLVVIAVWVTWVVVIGVLTKVLVEAGKKVEKDE